MQFTQCIHYAFRIHSAGFMLSSYHSFRGNSLHHTYRGNSPHALCGRVIPLILGLCPYTPIRITGFIVTPPGRMHARVAWDQWGLIVHCLDPLNLSTTKGNAPSALALFRSQALIQPGVIPLPALQEHTLEAWIQQRLYPLPSYTGRLRFNIVSILHLYYSSPACGIFQIHVCYYGHCHFRCGDCNDVAVLWVMPQWLGFAPKVVPLYSCLHVTALSSIS